MLGVQLYYYNIEGFLHWGYNFYNSCRSHAVLDPYGYPDGGFFTPSGDCFLVYPGQDGTAWESLRLNALREADAILREEFDNAGLAGKVWQYFIAVPDVKSVGVRNEMRYEAWPANIRAVNTTDAITASSEEIPYALLHKITDRITHEVEGINRVLYDLTPKPIGTIEWE